MPLSGSAGRPLKAAVRAFWRTTLVVIVIGALCTWQLVFSGAQAARADDSSWVPGNATATSQAFSIGPTQAGIIYAFTFGFSVADYQGSQSYSEAKTFDEGSAIRAAEVQECPGTSPSIAQSPANEPNDPQSTPPDILPNPVVSEAPSPAGGDDSHTMTLTSEYAQGTNLPNANAGLESASATVEPEGSALAKITQFGLPGVFDVSGAQSKATAQQVPGQVRKATATADVTELSLAGGLVDLKGLHWEDVQETGAGGAVVSRDASFSIAGLTISGTSVPVTGDSVSQLTDIINTALSGEGLHVTIPTAVTDQSGEEDIGPMSVGIDNSQLLLQALGPVWGQVNNGIGPIKGYGSTATGLQQNQNPYTGQPIVATGNPMVDEQAAQQLCGFNTPTGAASILASVLTGGGTLDLTLGGATALSQGISYANPFGNLGLGSAGNGDLGTTGSTFTPGSFTAGTPGTPGTNGTPGSSGNPLRVALGPASQRCLISCGTDHALLVGLIGLGAIVGMGVADFVRSRRRRIFEPSPFQ